MAAAAAAHKSLRAFAHKSNSLHRSKALITSIGAMQRSSFTIGGGGAVIGY